MEPPEIDRQMPSLGIIRDELNLRLSEQEHRATAFDGRAGLMLGFAGILVGLAADSPNIWQLIAQIIAVAAAGFAGWALWFRVSGAVGVRQLRERYLMEDAEYTRLKLLDTRIWLYEQDEKRLESKVFRMKWAVAFLGLSVIFMVVGSIVEYADAPTGGADAPRSNHGHHTR